MRQSGRGIEMKDLYLIDGYNVIFWLPEEFPRTDLESSRKKLVDLMQDYGAHNDVAVYQQCTESLYIFQPDE